MIPSENGSTVYLYPKGEVSFYFTTDETIRKNIGEYFIECTKSNNGKYITISDTNIPFLPKTNPFVWGTPIGDYNDLDTMQELFKTPRDGDCEIQTEFMVKLATDNGIITRRINLWQAPANGILTAGGHTVMEIYDRKTKQWIWADPLYNIIKGEINGRPITLYDLQIAVNRGENIVLTDTNGNEIMFDKWEHARTYRNYLNPSQKITFVIPVYQTT